MNEIKFRALNRETGEWYYGCQNPDKENPFEISLSRFWLKVEEGILDPETVGQYVCKDKHRKDVFADDTCNITYDVSLPHEDKAAYRKATATILYDDERLRWFWTVNDQHKTIIDIDDFEITSIELIKEKAE